MDQGTNKGLESNQVGGYDESKQGFSFGGVSAKTTPVVFSAKTAPIGAALGMGQRDQGMTSAQQQSDYYFNLKRKQMSNTLRSRSSAFGSSGRLISGLGSGYHSNSFSEFSNNNADMRGNVPQFGGSFSFGQSNQTPIGVSEHGTNERGGGMMESMDSTPIEPQHDIKRKGIFGAPNSMLGVVPNFAQGAQTSGQGIFGLPTFGNAFSAQNSFNSNMNVENTNPRIFKDQFPAQRMTGGLFGGDTGVNKQPVETFGAGLSVGKQSLDQGSIFNRPFSMSAGGSTLFGSSKIGKTDEMQSSAQLPPNNCSFNGANTAGVPQFGGFMMAGQQSPGIFGKPMQEPQSGSPPNKKVELQKSPTQPQSSDLSQVEGLSQTAFSFKDTTFGSSVGPKPESNVQATKPQFIPSSDPSFAQPVAPFGKSQDALDPKAQHSKDGFRFGIQLPGSTQGQSRDKGGPFGDNAMSVANKHPEQQPSDKTFSQVEPQGLQKQGSKQAQYIPAESSTLAANFPGKDTTEHASIGGLHTYKPDNSIGVNAQQAANVQDSLFDPAKSQNQPLAANISPETKVGANAAGVTGAAEDAKVESPAQLPALKQDTHISQDGQLSDRNSNNAADGEDDSLKTAPGISGGTPHSHKEVDDSAQPVKLPPSNQEFTVNAHPLPNFSLGTTGSLFSFTPKTQIGLTDPSPAGYSGASIFKSNVRLDEKNKDLSDAAGKHPPSKVTSSLLKSHSLEDHKPDDVKKTPLDVMKDRAQSSLGGVQNAQNQGSNLTDTVSGGPEDITKTSDTGKEKLPAPSSQISALFKTPDASKLSHFAQEKSSLGVLDPLKPHGLFSSNIAQTSASAPQKPSSIFNFPTDMQKKPAKFTDIKAPEVNNDTKPLPTDLAPGYHLPKVSSVDTVVKRNSPLEKRKSVFADDDPYPSKYPFAKMRAKSDNIDQIAKYKHLSEQSLQPKHDPLPTKSDNAHDIKSPQSPRASLDSSKVVDKNLGNSDSSIFAVPPTSPTEPEKSQINDDYKKELGTSGKPPFRFSAPGGSTAPKPREPSSKYPNNYMKFGTSKKRSGDPLEKDDISQGESTARNDARELLSDPKHALSDSSKRKKLGYDQSPSQFITMSYPAFAAEGFNMDILKRCPQELRKEVCEIMLKMAILNKSVVKLVVNYDSKYKIPDYSRSFIDYTSKMLSLKEKFNCIISKACPNALQHTESDVPLKKKVK